MRNPLLQPKTAAAQRQEIRGRFKELAATYPEMVCDECGHKLRRDVKPHGTAGVLLVGLHCDGCGWAIGKLTGLVKATVRKGRRRVKKPA